MIIDAHTHLGVPGSISSWPSNAGGYESEEETKDPVTGLLDIMDECGVAKAVVLPTSGELTSKALPKLHDYIAAILKKHPDRLVSFAAGSPRHREESIKEIDRCINELGFKGIKIHPLVDGFAMDSEVVYPVIEKAIKLDVPITVHSDFRMEFASPYLIVDTAERYPEAKMLLAHMGYHPSDIFRTPKLIKRHENLMLDICATPPCPKLIHAAVRELGAERVIFGSDATWAHPGLQIQKVKLLKITEEEKSLILGGNIARILKLPT